MKIPSKLKIGGHVFRVVVKEMSECGLTKRTLNEIWIANDLSQTQKEVTLIHEILHAINGEQDHKLLDSFSEQIYQVLKDNNLLKQ
jgi:hypothetical protein